MNLRKKLCYGTGEGEVRVRLPGGRKRRESQTLDIKTWAETRAPTELGIPKYLESTMSAIFEQTITVDALPRKVPVLTWQLVFYLQMLKTFCVYRLATEWPTQSIQ